MDNETILVGHALQNDLNVLGILHNTVMIKKDEAEGILVQEEFGDN